MIDGSIQPISLIIELDHGLINRDVIRAPTSFGLWFCLMNPVVNGGSSVADTEYLKNRDGIRK